jgi:hypothetical protein
VSELRRYLSGAVTYLAESLRSELSEPDGPGHPQMAGTASPRSRHVAAFRFLLVALVAEGTAAQVAQ